MWNSYLHKFRNECCTLAVLKQKLPILQWLPKYQLSYLYSDAVAGITVALMLLPQALAYAHLATLHPQFGLYSSFVGCFVYFFLGTSKDITLGPTALMSLLTAEFCNVARANSFIYSTVLCLITGCVQLLLGIIHLGIIVEFISHPVISGFTTSAAVIIAWGQVKSLLGLKHIPRDFVSSVISVFKNITKTNFADLGLGLSCLAALLLMRLLRVPHQEGETRMQKVARTFLFFLTTGKNAVVVIAASFIAFSLLSIGNDSLTLTQKVETGLPSFQVPSFQILNGTEVLVTTGQMFSDIGAGFVIVPLMGIVEAIAIGQAFARENSYRLDPNQELTAIGMSNILGAFVRAYPVTGSFSRTAVNSQSGSRSPVGGIFTGVLVILAMAVLTGSFRYIPQAALAAVIIMAVLQMSDFSLLRVMWRVRKVDIIPWIMTFVGSLALGIQYGIIIGVGVSFLLLLYSFARLTITSTSNNIGASVSGRDLMFPAADYLETRLHTDLLDLSEPCFVLDLSHIVSIDFSIAHALSVVSKDFLKHDKKLVLIVPHEDVQDVLRRCDPQILFFASCQEAVMAIPEISDSFDERTWLLRSTNPQYSISPSAVVPVSS